MVQQLVRPRNQSLRPRDVMLTIKRMGVAFILLAVMMYGIVHLFKVIPTSFVPNEDQGFVFAQVIMPDAASMKRTIGTSSKVAELFANNSAVADRTIVNGYSFIDGQYKSNVAAIFRDVQGFQGALLRRSRLPRRKTIKAIVLDVYGESQHVDSGVFLPIAPPAIPGIGTGSGFEFWIQDKASGDPVRLNDVTQQFIAEAAKNPA